MAYGVADIRTTLPRLAVLVAGLTLIAAAPSKAPTRDELAKNNKLFLQGAIKALKWEQPVKPLRIVGPIYFVGTQGLGSYLINTSDGLILMGTGMPSSGPMIADSIRELGFRPENIKLILTWHAHADHAGAIAYFKQLSGANLALMAGDVAAMEDGGKSDFHYGWDWKTMGWLAVEPKKISSRNAISACGSILPHTVPAETALKLGFLCAIASREKDRAALRRLADDGAGANFRTISQPMEITSFYSGVMASMHRA